MPLKFLSALVLLLALCATAAEFETPAQPVASGILPANLVKGPNFTVDEAVGTEGFLYTFRLRSDFGTFEVVSEEMLRLRIYEIAVLSKMSEVSGGEVFLNSMKDSVVQVPVQSLKLISEPVQSVKNIGTGVGNKFKSVGRFFSSERDKSKYEDSTFTDMSLGSRKRQLAAQFGVDVYSSNPKIQKALNHLARMQAAGQLPMRAAGLVVPPLGWGLRVLDLRRDISEDLVKKSPSELFAMNNKVLQHLDIEEDIREGFLNNENYSPRHKTAITANLEAMKRIEGLENFLITTLEDKTEEEALFAERQSEMILYYHKQIEPIQKIHVSGNVPICMTRSGKLVLFGPIDFGCWNERAESTFKHLDSLPSTRGATEKIVYFKGPLTPLARQKLAEMGYRVNDNFLRSDR